MDLWRVAICKIKLSKFLTQEFEFHKKTKDFTEFVSRVLWKFPSWVLSEWGKIDVPHSRERQTIFPTLYKEVESVHTCFVVLLLTTSNLFYLGTGSINKLIQPL